MGLGLVRVRFRFSYLCMYILVTSFPGLLKVFRRAEFFHGNFSMGIFPWEFFRRVIEKFPWELPRRVSNYRQHDSHGNFDLYDFNIFLMIT